MARQDGDNLRNSVDSIINMNVSLLTLNSKWAIKKLGRPTPILKLNQTCQKKKEGRFFTRLFTSDIYARNKWICGCNVRNSLFCFPCLLFFTSDMDKNWSQIGISDLNHLHEKIKKHEVSKPHLQASMELALLGEVDIAEQLSGIFRWNIAKYNKGVKRNRHILKRIISGIKFCNVFESALIDRGEKEESSSRDILKGLTNFSTELDVLLKEQLTMSSGFSGTSNTVQDDVLDCMLDVCRNEILNEIADADFLSIQCDEIMDVSNHCEMVLILRYVKGYDICERFWSFLRITDDTTDVVIKHIKKAVNTLIKNPNKLIAQSYDGTSVMSHPLGGVQAIMREKYPYAYFVHCYAHQLSLIMQKSAAKDPQARSFFMDLSAFPAFFRNSTHRCDTLEEIVKDRLPCIGATWWNNEVRIVSTVYENRDSLILCFEEIAMTINNKITAREANGLKRTLLDSTFIFWLTFFYKLLPHIDILYDQFQSRQIDNIQLEDAISTFETSMSNICDAVETTQEWLGEHVSKRRRLDASGENLAAKKLCDIIASQTKARLSFRGHLEANKLLTNDLYTYFNNTFPHEIFNNVTEMYPMLVKEQLKSELEIIYSRSEFSQVYGAKTTLAFILKNDLGDTFSETVKLIKIILTTPMDTAEVDRCFPTLTRTKTLLRNSISSNKLDALGMMSINKEFVHDIANFDEKVLEKFVALNNRQLDFSFKT